MKKYAFRAFLLLMVLALLGNSALASGLPSRDSADVFDSESGYEEVPVSSSDVPDFQDFVDFKLSVESEGMLAAKGNTTYARYGITYTTSEKFKSVITGVEAFVDALTALDFEGDEPATYFLQDAHTSYKLARGEGYYKFRYIGTGSVADVVTDLSGSFALTINIQKYMGNEQTFIQLNISPDLIYEGASR